MAAGALTMEQVRELVLLAREDAALWEALKENERRLERAAALGDDAYDPDTALGSPSTLTLTVMVAELVDRHYETDEDVDYQPLILMLRCAVREDLGLPVEIDWDRDIKGVH
jgi:hypothetical protein